MKRMHIHVGVDDLDRSIRFYSALFGAEPAKVRRDYAKWMLDDPCVNFAISTRTGRKGVDHLGLQADADSELAELRERLVNADISTFDEGETVCCYARSDNSWVEDPAGVAWEAYRSMADAQFFSDREPTGEHACCTPQTKERSECCAPKTGGGECCEP